MATAVVSERALRTKSLPPVSVKSGEPAAGFAPDHRGPDTVYYPLTQTEFDRLVALRRRQRSAVVGGISCLVFGLVLARFPAMIPLGVTIAALSALMWGLAWWGIRGLLPRRRGGPTANTAELRGVHRGFVAAVTEADAC